MEPLVFDISTYEGASPISPEFCTRPLYPSHSPYAFYALGFASTTVACAPLQIHVSPCRTPLSVVPQVEA